MDKFTPEFIAEQLAIAAKATPRPWKQSLDRIYYKVHDSVGFQEWTSMNAHYLDGSPVDDSAYIVAAANNYPAALDEIERLREALEKIRGVAGNRANPEADKAVIIGIVNDALKGGEG